MEEEQDNDDGQLMEDDYYALLNVPRDVSLLIEWNGIKIMSLIFSLL